MIKIPHWALAISLSVGCLALGIWATESVGFEHSFKMWIGFLALICAGGLASMAGCLAASNGRWSRE
jgi:hypothetical protein